MKLLKGLIGSLLVLALVAVVWYKGYGAHETNSPTAATLAQEKKADYLKKYEATKDYKVNDKITLGNLDFQVIGISDADKIRVKNKNINPCGVFKIVKVRIFNNDIYERRIDCDMFKVIDNNNNTYSADMNLSSDYNNGTNAQFFSKELNPKLTTTGYIIFDLPKGAGNSYKIQIRDSRYSFDEANVIMQ